MLDVNAYQYMMIHKVFLPVLKLRMAQGKRCALVGVSSSSWLRYFPKFIVYTATKAYASYLSQAMQKEKGSLQDYKLLDLHCFSPFATATNIVDHTFIRMATPTSVAVNIALRDLGSHDFTYGTVLNEIIAKFSFILMGKYLAPLFDLIMVICGYQI